MIQDFSNNPVGQMPEVSCTDAFDAKVVVHLSENGLDLRVDSLCYMEDGFEQIRKSCYVWSGPKD